MKVLGREKQLVFKGLKIAIGLKVVLTGIFLVIAILALFNYSGTQNNLPTASYAVNHNTQPFSYQPLTADKITFNEIFWLLILGLVSGTIGGMLGMGGGLLKVSGMYLFFGYEVILARVITLLTYSCISFSAFLKYREFKLIIWEVARLLAISAVVGVIAGVLLGNLINGIWLEKLVGLYAIVIGLVIVFQLKKGTGNNKSEWKYNPSYDKKISIIGILKGFFCGLFGISGGVISVPLQQLLLKIPVKNSIANSLTSAMFSATFAAFLALSTGVASGFFKLSLPLMLTLPLIPGTIIGARIGAGLTKKMDTHLIKVFFSVIAFLMGIRILFFSM